MARMPQIPEPEINNRPDSRVGRMETPDIAAVTEPFQMGASALESNASQLERLQDQRDAATAKLQHVADATTAEQMKGDHEEKLRNLADQLQQQMWKTPEQFPEAFRKQSQELTDSELKAMSPGVASVASEKYAAVDNQHLTMAHGWMLGRTAQMAKDNVFKLQQSSVRTAQSAATLPGLAVAIANTKKDLGPLLPQIHGENAEKVAEETAHNQASAWVESNGPSNPTGVRAAIADAIKTKSGPLWDNIPEAKLLKYQKESESWMHGYGERQRGQVAAEAVDFNTKTLDMFHSKELDTKAFYQMRDSLVQKQLKIQHDPQYKDNPDERVKQNEIVQTQVDTMDALKAASQGGGHWNGKFDPKKTAALFTRFEAVSKSDQRAPTDLLKVWQVQRDVAQAQAHHWIAPGDAETLTRSLKLMTGKQLAAKSGAQSMGPIKSPISPDTVRTMGASALDGYMKSGAYGKLSPEETTAMRVEYHHLITDAGENGRNVDENAAKKLAQLAVQHVLARHKVVGE